jgi:chromate reductase
MITIISSTNRQNSEALRFAKHYQEVIQSMTDEEVKLLALENIPHDWFHPQMFDKGQMTASLKSLQDEFILPARKFVFIIPEYNGGVPGSLKLFIDACSVRNYQQNFKGKKSALVGIASGRAGNLRGMDHLTGVLNHLGSIVMPNRLPISSISKLINEAGRITDPGTVKGINNQMEEFLAF